MTGRSVFVIGATGLIGGAVARRLTAAGWAVSGLARTTDAGETFRSVGIDPVIGDLQAELPAVLEHAATADVVVLAAQLDGPAEHRVIDALLPRLVGKTLLFVSGSGVMLQRAVGQWRDTSYAEADAFPVEPLAADRRASEVAVLTGHESGVRTVVVRAGMVWGPGGHGIVPMVYRSVAAFGAAAYIGEGRNVYSEVHLEDLTALIEAAIERGTPGALYHAVGGETPTRWVAEAVAQDLGVSTQSITPKEAEEVWGAFGALIAGATSRISAPRSRDELGWVPHHTDMLTEIGNPKLRKLSEKQS